MQAIYGDVEGMRFVGDSQPLTVENCRYWIEVTDKNFERRGYGMVAFVDRESSLMVGCGGVVHPNQQEEPEVKYAFRRDQWGKGYATESVLALVAYARNTLVIGRLIATIHPGNGASQRVMEKVGFARGEDRTNEDGSLTQIWALE